MKTPPRILTWLLNVLCPSDRQDLKGDFLELYEYRQEQAGRLYANSKFLSDILSVIPFRFLVKKELTHRNNVFMLATNLKIAKRNLVKNKLYSTINFIGLSVSLTAFILIALYVKDELSYDKHFKNSEQLYRIAGYYYQGGENPISSASSSYTLLPLIEGKLKGVDEMVRVAFHYEMITINSKDKYMQDYIVYADSTFFSIFSVPFVSGDPVTALDDPSSVVLDQATGRKYFGNEDPMGKSIEMNGKQFKVSGVMKTFPANSHFTCKVIFPMSGVVQWFPDWVLHDPSGTSMYTYFKAGKDLNQAETERIINEQIKKQGGQEKYPTLFLQPVTSIHLKSNLNKGEIEANGSETNVYIFSITALIILVLACINYINLSMAVSLQRIKEISMKRIFGSTTRSQLTQFQTESLLVVSISALLALIFARLVMPFFNNVSGKSLEPDLLASPDIVLGLVVLILLLGSIAGSFPALTLLKMGTVSMLSGKLSLKGKSYFRNILITFQFAISIALIASTLIVMEQISFIRKKDLGVDPEHLVIIPFQSHDVADKYELIKNEMMRSAAVLAISATSNKVTHYIAGWRPYKIEGEKDQVTIPSLAVSYDFFESMGAKMAQGRSFSKDFPSDLKNAYIINESAAKFLKREKPIGSRLLGYTFTGAKWFEKDATIIGVVKDFHFASLHSAVAPIVFSLGSETTEGYLWMQVRITNGSPRETIHFLEGVWRKIAPGLPFQFEFMDEEIQRSYTAEDRFLKIFVAFASLSILLGGLGLFGLTAFIAKRRTKEIGIRKVIGASTMRLIRILSVDFMKLVLIANLIGWPVAYYFMDKWLQNFAYHTSISVWIFIMTGAAAILIAFLAILYHSLKVSWANPVKALKYE